MATEKGMAEGLHEEELHPAVMEVFEAINAGEPDAETAKEILAGLYERGVLDEQRRIVDAVLEQPILLSRQADDETAKVFLRRLALDPDIASDAVNDGSEQTREKDDVRAEEVERIARIEAANKRDDENRSAVRQKTEVVAGIVLKSMGVPPRKRTK